MKRFAFVSFVCIILVAVVVAEVREKKLTLGDPEVVTLKKCANGNCIGLMVAVPEGHHVTGITKEGSDYVHPCDQTNNCGHSKAWIPIEGSPNKAQWLGWTDSGDPTQAFVLKIAYQ